MLRVKRLAIFSSTLSYPEQPARSRLFTAATSAPSDPFSDQAKTPISRGRHG